MENKPRGERPFFKKMGLGGRYGSVNTWSLNGGSLNDDRDEEEVLSWLGLTMNKLTKIFLNKMRTTPPEWREFS